MERKIDGVTFDKKSNKYKVDVIKERKYNIVFYTDIKNAVLARIKIERLNNIWHDTKTSAYAYWIEEVLGKVVDRNVLSQKYLHKLFYYNDETGGLYWKSKPLKTHVSINDRVGAEEVRDGKQYIRRRISLYRKKYTEAILVWIYHTGKLPEYQIDHIDRDPTNNRIGNLRDITNKENQYNKSTLSNSKSGIKGITSYKYGYNVRITFNGFQQCLYKGKDIIEAAAVRLAAEQCVGHDKIMKESPAYLYLKNIIPTIR